MALLFQTGCGGRTANPVSEYQVGDENRSCEGLRVEIANNEQEMARLLPDESATGKNVALGVAGAFLIVPWFFMDFKEGEATEIQALRRRNNRLRVFAGEKNCDIPPSRFLAAGLPCSDAKDKNRPWIGQWAQTVGRDTLALELTEYQVDGQLTTPDGTFQVSGRVDDRGEVEAKISATWATGKLRGTFPHLLARAESDGRMGELKSSADTEFTMCH